MGEFWKCRENGCDFKIRKISSKKIKKDDLKSLKLITNIDILKKISTQKKHRPKYVVGFSAETDSKILAKKKLKEKNCDMIVYNKISKKNRVFGSDENKISVLTKNKMVLSLQDVEITNQMYSARIFFSESLDKLKEYLFEEGFIFKRNGNKFYLTKKWQSNRFLILTLTQFIQKKILLKIPQILRHLIIYQNFQNGKIEW